MMADILFFCILAVALLGATAVLLRQWWCRSLAGECICGTDGPDAGVMAIFFGEGNHALNCPRYDDERYERAN